MSRVGRQGAPPGPLLRLAARGLRSGARQFVASCLIGGLGVIVLLAGLAVLPIATAQRDTQAARTPQPASARSDSGLLLETATSAYRGETIRGREVAVVGGSDLRPPGLTTIPGPGRLVVSPALRDLLAVDPILRERIPGTVVGVIARPGLVGPKELAYYAGVSAAELAARGVHVTTAFADPEFTDLAVPSEVRMGGPFISITFFLPVFSLFVVVALAGSERRDRRLAALRLVGLTTRDVRVLAAVEAALMGLVAAALGGLAFAASARALAPHVPLGPGVWPTDVEIPWTGIVGAGLVLPLLSVSVVDRAGRRARKTPTAGHAPAGPPLRSGRRLAVLAVGVVLMAAAEPTRLVLGVDPAVAVLGLGCLLTMIGLVISAGSLARWSARAVNRRTSAVPGLVAAAQVGRRPDESARVAVGMSLLVFVSGLLLSFFPLLSSSDAEAARDLAERVGGRAIIAQVPSAATVSAIAADEGVAAVIEAHVTGEGPGRSTMLTCSGIEHVAGDCAGEAARAVVAALRANQVVDFDLEPELVASVPLATWSEPVAQHSVVVLPRPSADVEAVRTAVLRAGGTGEVLTANERREARMLETKVFREATLVALVLAALVGLASLTAGVLDSVQRQRRSLRMLHVMGVGRRDLGGALLRQCALAVGPALVVAWLSGLLASVVFLRLNDTSTLTPPSASVLGVLAAAAALPLIATALVIPRLNRLVQLRSTE